MKGLLKFITCGSVDDGKSTLIGHILYDAKLLYADQKRALELESKVGSRGGEVDYALLLDGLMAEREQGITIDVAYRYFSTKARSFIAADTPGHEEYTRNMAVGASFADLAVILVDAGKGVLTQTRRHARICSMMGIRHVIFAVNKMDLIEYSLQRFLEIEKELEVLNKELGLRQVISIPVSATEGDNVTKKSDQMPWYQGPALLECLETIDIAKFREEGFVLPIQRVSRPDHTFRGFQGQIEAGEIFVGDPVKVLPGNQEAKVKQIIVGDKQADQAFFGQAVTIGLDREVDVSRGCVLTSQTGFFPVKQFESKLLWMDSEELTEGREFLIKTSGNMVSGIIEKINYKIDVNTGEQMETSQLQKNEIGSCKISLVHPVVLDLFENHRIMGELIVIDRLTNMTSACGVVEQVERSDGTKDQKDIFSSGDLTAKTELFTEYYYHINGESGIRKEESSGNYKVGDEIPRQGKSYTYPESFDILDIKEEAAVLIRKGIVYKILPIREYDYEGYPVLNEIGFSISINPHETSDFIQKFLQKTDETELEFGPYRSLKLYGKK